MCLGIPARIVAIVDAERALARVDIQGVRRDVNIACIIDAAHEAQDCVGAWVLVHVGFALSRLDADEARRTLELLARIEAIEAQAADHAIR
jgi:hydrogenase expression/formation protein HypC